jgi:hypothetical protein
MLELKKNTEGWVVVTNCSSIKRRIGEAITPALSHRTIENLCNSWIKKIQKATDLKSVGETYGGRTFTESLQATKRLNAELYVISAGLGLVHFDDLIPNYELTISQGNGSIANWLTEKGYASVEWWSLLNNKLKSIDPILNLVKRYEGILLTVPSTYLELISDELLRIPLNDLKKLYIITSPVGQRNLNYIIRNRCIPYDERLNASLDYQGTRNDFPQRALKHLTTELDFQKMSMRTLQNEVLTYLNTYKIPTIPHRKKVDDEEIKRLIRSNWINHQGKSHGIHRYIRDEAKVACEQKRFSNLWNEVKIEMRGKNFS